MSKDKNNHKGITRTNGFMPQDIKSNFISPNNKTNIEENKLMMNRFVNNRKTLLLSSLSITKSPVHSQRYMETLKHSLRTFEKFINYKKWIIKKDQKVHSKKKKPRLFERSAQDKVDTFLSVTSLSRSQMQIQRTQARQKYNWLNNQSNLNFKNIHKQRLKTQNSIRKKIIKTGPGYLAGIKYKKDEEFNKKQLPKHEISPWPNEWPNQQDISLPMK